MTASNRVVVREVVLVVAAALIQIGGPLLIASHRDEVALPPVGGVLLLAIGVATIPLRLVNPVAALLVAHASTTAYSSLEYARGPIFVAVLITFGNAVLSGHRRMALATLAVGYVGSLWLGPALGRGDAPGLDNAVGLAAWLLVLFTGCELIRMRRDRAREAEMAKADTLQRQIANERLSIARELHDVVAHNMSLINLQAGVALHVNDGLPAPALEALQTIKSASKEALVEMRSILGVLRHADDGEDAPRAPAPSLANVAELVARASSAGVEITLRIDIESRDLPRTVDIAAYRIVQESLTNVARHANPPVATVTVRRSDGVLVISIVDVGTGQRRAEHLTGGGNGIPGMRERAASVGGTLIAGPRLGGGFAVDARLPITDPPEASFRADPM